MDSTTETRNSRDRLGDKSFNRVLMQVVGPILIMLMVGSLVFFLIEIFYRGPHALRLGWVLGLFTAASVLVSRISIEEGLERAALFGFALAAATLFVTISLVDFEYGAFFVLEPVVVTLLIAVVMWSSNRLTWDCTVIDASRDVSSIGLSELVKRKLFKRNQNATKKSLNADENDAAKEIPASSFSRILFYFFANSKNNNTPGLWVFYFAVAAFPIFGFGQWFASPSDAWGYRWIFMLFAIYLGSALGLLMLTSLLGLERYLRQRGALIPASISRSWIGVGTAFALVVMLVMLLLPSPSISNGFQDALAFLTTKNKNTSQHAIGKDGQEEGENAKDQKQDQDAKGAQEKPGEKGSGNGDKGQGGDSKSNAKGNDSSGDKKSNSESKDKSKSRDTDNSDKSNDKQKNKSQDQSDSKQKSDTDRDKNGDPKNNDAKQNEQNRDQQDEDEDEKEQKENNRGNQQEDQQPDNDRQAKKKQGGQRNANPPPQRSTSNSPSALVKFLATVMKYIVYIVAFVAMIVVLWMFRDELAKLWNDFFGKKKSESEKEDTPTHRVAAAKPKMSFSNYSNPFTSGFADKWPPANTIQYTFEALEAWGRGHGIPREHDQTPHEFAKQVNQVDEGVAVEAKRLADLFGESLYSGDEVQRSSLPQLQRIWQLMNSNSPLVTDSSATENVELAANS